jgi:hypothetical protein
VFCFLSVVGDWFVDPQLSALGASLANKHDALPGLGPNASDSARNRDFSRGIQDIESMMLWVKREKFYPTVWFLMLNEAPFDASSDPHQTLEILRAALIKSPLREILGAKRGLSR